MPDLQLRWANVERLVVGWLKERTDATVYTETGEDLAAVAAATGAIVVQRAGGSGDLIDRDVDIELNAIAGSRPAMWDLAGDVETAMADLATDATEEGYVDDVALSFGWADDPHDNPAVRRATATYRLTVRPRR